MQFCVLLLAVCNSVFYDQWFELFGKQHGAGACFNDAPAPPPDGRLMMLLTPCCSFFSAAAEARLAIKFAPTRAPPPPPGLRLAPGGGAPFLLPPPPEPRELNLQRIDNETTSERHTNS